MAEGRKNLIQIKAFPIRLLQAGRMEQSEPMKLIPLLLLTGMLVVSGCAKKVLYGGFSPQLVKMAEAGNARAQNNLGDCYYEGKGVAQDYKEAVKWFTKSAEQGDWMGQANLGKCYLDGKGVAQDKEEGRRWTEKGTMQLMRNPNLR
jgi:hypothetical protein